MGTDIHLYVEKKEGSRWVSQDEEREADWGKELETKFGDGSPADFKERTPKDEDEIRWGHRWVWRNYNLFSILADVRNGYGFAGCDTGDRIEVIAQPRGFPSDASPELRREWERHGEHTPSHLTLKEILDWPGWDGVKVMRGIISRLEYENWDHRAPPESWSGGISGPGITVVEEGEWKTATPDPTRTYHIRVSWRQPYRDLCRGFWKTVIPQLKAVDPDPANVRIVFWFDS